MTEELVSLVEARSPHGDNAIHRVVFYNQVPSPCGTSLTSDTSPRRRTESNRQELSKEYLARAQHQAQADVASVPPLSAYERLSVAGANLYHSINQMEGWLCSDLDNNRTSQDMEDGDWWTGKVSLYQVVKKELCAQEDSVLLTDNESLTRTKVTKPVLVPEPPISTSWRNPWRLFQSSSEGLRIDHPVVYSDSDQDLSSNTSHLSSTREFIRSGESMYLCFLALFLIHYLYLLVRVTKQRSGDRHRSHGVCSSLRTIVEESEDELTSCDEDVLQQIENLYQEDVIVQPKKRLDAVPDVVDCYLKDDEDELLGLELRVRIRGPSLKVNKTERPPSVAALSGSALSLLECDCETVSVSSALSLDSFFSQDSDDESDYEITQLNVGYRKPAHM